jgi:glycosyltransferase involved in cell wall biosynthesis
MTSLATKIQDEAITNNNLPLISVITVVYNTDKTLEETIISVINQTYPRFEYIVVDGASTDDTLKIIKTYEENLKWVSERDKGIYDAMNKGLGLATGDWVIFLGADDVFYNNDVLKDVVAGITSKDAIYYGNAIFKSTKNLYDVTISKWFLSLRNISHQTIFYPKSIYKKYTYDLHYSLFSDHIYNLTLFAENKFQFIHLPVTTVLYNDAGSSNEGNDPNYFKELPGIVSKLLGNKYSVYVYFRFKVFKSKLGIIRFMKKIKTNISR